MSNLEEEAFTAKRFIERLEAYRSPEVAEGYRHLASDEEDQIIGVRMGEVDDAFKIAEALLDDDQDLVNKATGWALREAGKKERQRLLSFLDQYAATMPRVTLRYAIEPFDKEERAYYLGLKKRSV